MSQNYQYTAFKKLAFAITTLVCATLVISPTVFSQEGVSEAQLKSAVATVKSIGLNGDGNVDAVKAMEVLNRSTAQQIPALLEAMDGTTPISANWIRGAIQSASRSGEFPLAEVKSYFGDTSKSHLGRLQAFEMLAAADTTFAENTIPTLLNDPSLPLRLKAVENLIEQATAIEDEKDATRLAKLNEALPAARDVEQVKTIAGMLESGGQTVDLQKQLGLIPKWSLVGSFDNKDQKGFDVDYGPESNPAAIDLEAAYPSIDPAEAVWTEHTTEESLGEVDLNEVIGKVKGAIVYAHTTFDSPEAREVELRIGTPNAHKIYVNGELVLSNEIYHNSNSIDKFSCKAKVKPGPNVILIKLCQNEQTQPWAQDWMFQLRVCDETGKAINSL
jgi:hypothetical protein